MRQVALPGAGPGLSRLGFGCAPVMGRVGRRAALDAMACAFDCGVTHFDIARSYGFGDAERVLGEFARTRRDRVTIASKFGIVPPRLSAWKKAARPLVRPLMKLAAPLRRSVGRAAGELLQARRFDVGYARECLETSLRALRTERLDLWLLHEPDLDALDGLPELRRFLDDAVGAGSLRAWGVAHPHAPAAAAALGDRGRVLQFESTASRAEPWPLRPDEDRLLIVTRPLSGGAFAAGAARAALPGLDPLQLAMATALAAVGAHGATVAGMFGREHVRRNAAAVEAYDRDRVVVDAMLAGAGFAVRDRAPAG